MVWDVWREGSCGVTRTEVAVADGAVCVAQGRLGRGEGVRFVRSGVQAKIWGLRKRSSLSYGR